MANVLCVLTKEDNFILDLIDKITDSDEKRNMLQKYLEAYKEKEEKVKNSENQLKLKEPKFYNLKDILNRVKTSNTSSSNSETSISELRHEVKILK